MAVVGTAARLLMLRLIAAPVPRWRRMPALALVASSAKALESCPSSLLALTIGGISGPRAPRRSGVRPSGFG